MKISNDKIANNLFSNSLNYSNDLDFLDIININLKGPESIIENTFATVIDEKNIKNNNEIKENKDKNIVKNEPILDI